MELDDDDDIPSTPTNSSPSSSDLDTQSTGSFFPDRSTTLGTLMGVTLDPASSHTIRPRPPTAPTYAAAQAAVPATNQRRRRQRRRRGRRSGWWKLCRDDAIGPTKLGEFLEVERRVDGSHHAGAPFVVDAEFGFNGEVVPRGEEGRLFEDGRVLPPATATATGGAMVERRRKTTAEVSAFLVRFPGINIPCCTALCSSHCQPLDCLEIRVGTDIKTIQRMTL